MTVNRTTTDAEKPPSPCTGFRTLFRDLGGDITHLPSVDSAIVTSIGGGLALGLHPLDDDVNRTLAGRDRGPGGIAQVHGAAASARWQAGLFVPLRTRRGHVRNGDGSRSPSLVARVATGVCLCHVRRHGASNFALVPEATRDGADVRTYTADVCRRRSLGRHQ